MSPILFHRNNLFMAASHSFKHLKTRTVMEQSLEQLLVKLVLDYVRAANKNALPERTADNESEGGEEDAHEGSKNTSCGSRRKSYDNRHQKKQ